MYAPQLDKDPLGAKIDCLVLGAMHPITDMIADFCFYGRTGSIIYRHRTMPSVSSARLPGDLYLRD